MNEPPKTVFYSETGGKSAPFYLALRGIKSAFKTSWHAKAGWLYNRTGPPKVFEGYVTWTEIDLKTGKDLVRIWDMHTHLAEWHQDLILSHDQAEAHDLHHKQDLDHVHP